MRHYWPWSTPVQSRRRLLAGGLAVLGTGAAGFRSARSQASETVTLRELATQKGLLYRTTIPMPAAGVCSCDLTPRLNAAVTNRRYSTGMPALRRPA
jgi:hypothetical protein